MIVWNKWVCACAANLISTTIAKDAAERLPSFDQNLTTEPIVHFKGNFDGAPSTAITEAEFDYCTTSLRDVATDGRVGEGEFMLFLESFSENKVQFDAFQEIPLQLLLAFYTAACTGGRNCHTEPPMISIDHMASSQAFLRVFCSSVKDITVSQLTFAFQYQVELDHVETLAMQPNAWSTLELARRLDQATRYILLASLGCIDVSKTPQKRKLRGSDHRILSWLEQPQKCDYSVQVPSTHLQKTRCLSRDNIPAETANQVCLLVTSEVKVTEAALFLNTNIEELRTILLGALQTSIYDGGFNDFLRMGEE